MPNPIAKNPQQALALFQAQQAIESLRRRYARATDQLAQTDDPRAQAQGLTAYHQLFAANARMRVSGLKAGPHKADGPDGWADTVRGAIGHYAATQHLIGTQLVEFEAVSFGADDTIKAGRAALSSYVQAWHNTDQGQLRLVVGTYHDTVTFNPGKGWQITEMHLVYTQSEERDLSWAD